jgi:hypothetical protein
MDGYGCSYSINSNNLRFSVSNMRSDGRTDARAMASNLEKSLVDMHDLCLTKPKL